MKWQYILHRVNKIEDLKKLEKHWGAEIDIRSNVQQNGQLHLSHDPWVQGDNFEEWVHAFSSCKVTGPIILNTKEDGLESEIIQILTKYNLNNWFFLDTAFPTLVKFSFKKCEPRFAVRLSCYEPIEALEPFVGKVQWAWVDCFGGIPLDVTIVKKAAQNFKICLVSPELVGKDFSQRDQFLEIASYAHAICTKYPETWRKSTAILSKNTITC